MIWRGATGGVLACLTSLLACSPPPRPIPPDPEPVRPVEIEHGRGGDAPAVTGPATEENAALAVARAEATRDVDALIARVNGADVRGTLLALRGLGRVGGPRALAALRAAIASAEPSVVVAAASALGVAASLDDRAAAGSADPLHAALVKTHDLAVIEALGRAGDETALPALVALVMAAAATPGDAATVARAETAAFALARYGRRKLPIDASARRALGAALATGDGRLRSAAAYALGREQRAPGDMDAPELVAALEKLAGAAAPELRATVAAALGKRGDAPAARATLVALLADPDWRVGVEAVRALGTGDVASQRAVADAMRTHAASARGTPIPELHVVLEALRVLLPATDAQVSARIAEVGTLLQTGTTPADARVARAWTECLAAAHAVRVTKGATLAKLDACGGPDGLPVEVRATVIADAIVAKAGSVADRRVHVGALVASPVIGVRLTAYAPLAALAALSDNDASLARTQLLSALATGDAILAGGAADALPALWAAVAPRAKVSPRSVAAAAVSDLEAAVVERARRELAATDPSLALQLVGVIGARKLAAGLPVCRDALAGHPALARAGAECLRDAGEPMPALAEPPRAPLPALDVAAAIATIEAPVVWHVVTSRGELDIALDAATAPWAVAAVTELTRRHFYDHTLWHRVVPNFVIQGGDPTNTGAGGPGFVLPPEPSSMTDQGPTGGFGAGGVGLADGGPGTAGSQWFVMHSDAPHLDGRYTWFGTLDPADQAIVDALQVGDAIVSARVEAR